MPQDDLRPSRLTHRKPEILPLFGGFLFTGAMTVLLGLMLPRVAALHHLKDSQCGTLLMAQFFTSACGALLVRCRFELTLMRGYALMAVGAVALLLIPGRFAVLAIGTFGLGLGMAMTSTSMLMGRIFPGSRGAVLSLLNFCWSIGATLCPIIIARLPGSFALPALCIPIALLSVVFAIVALMGDYSQLPHARTPAKALKEPKLSVFLLFAGVGFLYTGAESAVGGWMTTYASRAVMWDFGKSSLATACFWAALLVGRGLAPLILQYVSEMSLQLLSMTGVSVGVLMLVNAHSPVTLLAGACCTGLTLAPIFPLTISLFLASAGETRNAGWVFAISGFGGAVLPWLTGMVSTVTHSLRTGLLVCLAADAGMLLLSLLIVFSPASAQLKVAAADI